MSSTMQIRRWVATGVVVAALIAGGVLGIELNHWSSRPVFGASNVPVRVAKDNSPVSLGELRNGFASILKPALPAVVNISTSRWVKPPQQQMNPFFNDPFFQQFFGFQRRPQHEEDLGSGVIVSSDGTILTNNHVILDGASGIDVVLSDNRKFKAKLVGRDPNVDIAVLKIPATNLPTLALGDSSKLQVGDVVFAIGEPLGLHGTATMGIVSATGRSDLPTIGQIENIQDFIQTDAAINHGNSGGALIDMRGNLVGITTAIATGGGEGNIGIGFAIPINMVRHSLEEIEAHGKVLRGYIGVFEEDVTPDMAKQFGLSGAKGVLISEVQPNTPASRAGLRNGDIILSVNGTPVTDKGQLAALIGQMSPGTTAKLEIWRDQKSQAVNVTIGEFPETAENGAPGEQGGGGEQNVGKAMQGVHVENLTPDVIQQLAIPADVHGVVIRSLDDGSPAQAAGLQPGMVIEQVQRRPVANVGAYYQALSGVGDNSVLLYVYDPQSQGHIYLDVSPE